MEINKIDTRELEDGTIEHKHAYYDWWHPDKRIHSAQFMLKLSVGCAGDMWTSTDRNVEVHKKKMEFCLQQVTEARDINNRSYWMRKVLRLTTWGFVPKFKVEAEE